MSEFPLVSIITTTYKRFDKLFRTIQSVLDQNYQNFEYIITDDGSDNFPESDIRKYVDENRKPNLVDFRIIHHEKNLGTVRNLNYAYRLAKGLFFIEISGDDVFYDNNVVNQIVNRFISTNCEIVVASRLGIDENDSPLFFLPHYNERKKIERWNTDRKQYYAYVKGMYYDMASGSVMYYSRRIMETLNYFDESYDLWEDGPIISKYTWIGNLCFAYDILAIRYTLDGISSVGCKHSHARRRLISDLNKYCENELYWHYDELPEKIKRYVVFTHRLTTVASLKDRVLLCLPNLDIALEHIFYKFERIINKNLDKYYIKKLEIR